MRVTRFRSSILLKLLFANLLALILVACEQPGQAEKLGEKIDNAVESTGKSFQEASEAAEVSLDQQLEQAKEAMRTDPEK